MCVTIYRVPVPPYDISPVMGACTICVYLLLFVYVHSYVRKYTICIHLVCIWTAVCNIRMWIK